MPTSPLRALLSTLTLALLAAGAPARADGLRGAGATFPAPVYAAWALAWQARGGTAIRYDPLGSGWGVTLVEQGHVDFGGSDAPLSPDELARAGLRQFPTLIGGVVPVVNIAGIAAGRLALDAPTIGAIYRGEIRNWSDPAIAALNPGLALPDANITVVHRAEASGTTYLWSRWLAASDPRWKAAVGVGTTLAWPTGAEGQGNEGVASLVQRTRWAIGYVEYAYARQHHLSDVALPARDGGIVRAGRAAFRAAVAAAHWHAPADLEQDLTNEPGAGAWPIVGASFVLMRKAAPDPATAPLRAFFDWALSDGTRLVEDLDYVPLPPEATRLVAARLHDAP